MGNKRFLLKFSAFFILHFIFFICGSSASAALEPEEILILINKDIPASADIAGYYCEERNVPADNVLTLSLGASLNDTIGREDYNKKIAEPLRLKLSSHGFAGRIRCLLTTYGIPIRVGGRGPLESQQYRMGQLNAAIEEQKTASARLEPNTSAEQRKQIDIKLAKLRSEIDRINGKETGASVDSELSMLLSGDYELYRWQTNRLKYKMPYWDFKTLMVCRLDAPDAKTARGLIDKSLSAEKTGLKGIAYIDSRGIADNNESGSFGYYDRSMRELEGLIKAKTKLQTVEEKTDALFAPGSCFQTAIYCGWYSVCKYVDAFTFADGAVGYHIASFEAAHLHDPNSTEWCPMMLKKGIAATLGPVDEPYLGAFPEPKEFFSELFNGYCLVEAYYRTNPYNSWQMVLIGDPLYRPFKTKN